MFKFGGGTCLKSTGEFSIPAVLADKAVTIQTDVVQSDIPLLLSKDSMKQEAHGPHRSPEEHWTNKLTQKDCIKTKFHSKKDL